MNNKTYTEEDLKNAFNESRLTHSMVGFKHKSFEDYLMEASKQKPLEYEIEEYRYRGTGATATLRGNGTYYDKSFKGENVNGATKEQFAVFFSNHTHEIIKLRRLSDNQSFSIDEDTNFGKITGFTIEGERVKVEFYSIGNWQSLSSIEKATPKPVLFTTEVIWNDETLFDFMNSLWSNDKFDFDTFKKELEFFKSSKTKQVLFTTEDGVDIFKDNLVYSVRKHDFFMGEPFYAHNGSISLNENKTTNAWLYFSTQEAAQEYVELNQPKYSLQEIREELERNCSPEIQERIIRKLQKSK